ncbi:hypothetical protein ACV7JQ_08985 [Globicatella sulfidifaciens]
MENRNNVYQLKNTINGRIDNTDLNDSKSSERSGNYMDLLFKELKDDMREREVRSERRFQEQQELLLNRVDEKLKSIDKNIELKFGGLEAKINNVNDEIKKTRAENRYWFIGMIVAILTAVSPIIAKLIEILFATPPAIP